jgi:hypothetical protein
VRYGKKDTKAESSRGDEMARAFWAIGVAARAAPRARVSI